MEETKYYTPAPGGEVFSEIDGFEGLYAVSTQGTVLNLQTGKLKKHSVNKHGYHLIGLCKQGQKYNKFIHRLVACCYIPNHLDLSDVNHKNGIKSDNSVGNLEWMSREENRKHAVLNGLFSQRGEKNVRAKLTPDQVITIRMSSLKSKDLSLLYGITTSSVRSIKRRSTWNHI